MKIYLLSSEGWTTPYNNQWANETRDIKRVQPDLIVITSNCESAIHRIFGSLLQEIEPWAKSNNCRIVISSPSPTHTNTDTITYEQSYSNFLWIRNLSWQDYHNSQLAIPQSQHFHTYHFDLLYTCYNNRPRKHRAKLIDVLAQERLIDNNIVTFIYPEEYQWKYHDGSKLTDEQNFELNANEDFYPWVYAQNHYKGFVDIVTESFSSNIQHMTEKTMKPVMMHKLFIALSSPGYNTDYLVNKFGFKLYDNIFDYSFDSNPNEDIRIKGIVENLKRLNSLSINKRIDLYKQSIPTLIHNKNRLVELIFDKNKVIPECLHFAFDEYSKHEWYGRSEVIDYALQMGWFK